MHNLTALIMGVVEGLTEFLPISSTGHLILISHLLGFEAMVGKEVASAFTIVIQLGAILAVVAAYPRRFARLLRWDDNRGFSGLRGIALLVVTSLPAAMLGLAAHHFIKDYLFTPSTVAAAMAVGAIWILWIEQRRPRARTEGIDALSWKEALSVGLFQCLSLWPGMSRSASMILGGMMTGLERKTATEYSFFAAVPVMAAATLYELLRTPALLSHAHIGMFTIGFVVSFVSAWAAVELFIRFVAHHTLAPFGWYRLAMAAMVVAWVVY